MEDFKKLIEDFQTLCHVNGFSSSEIACIMSVVNTLTSDTQTDYNNSDFIEKCNKTYKYIVGKEIAVEFMAILKIKKKWGLFKHLSSNYMLISTKKMI